jgi:hypothetical protein
MPSPPNTVQAGNFYNSVCGNKLWLNTTKLAEAQVDYQFALRAFEGEQSHLQAMDNQAQELPPLPVRWLLSLPLPGFLLRPVSSLLTATLNTLGMILLGPQPANPSPASADNEPNGQRLAAAMPAAQRGRLEAMILSFFFGSTRENRSTKVSETELSIRELNDFAGSDFFSKRTVEASSGSSMGGGSSGDGSPS